MEKSTYREFLRLLLIIYFGVIKTRKMRWEEHVEHMRERRVSYRVLVGKSDGRGTLGRCRSRWEDNIKLIFR